MKVLIIGYGEVGSAHADLLARRHDVKAFDVDPDKVPDRYKTSAEEMEGWPDFLLIAFPDMENFVKIARDVVKKHRPKIAVNILSTVKPGTCEKVGEIFLHVCHSTTRGLHPDLKSGLLTIPKHVSGPGAESLASLYRSVGMRCITHERAVTTEVAHILNNVAYGVNLVLADEMSKICRAYGVDYVQAVMAYTSTNNEGYERLDHRSKNRMILTPPNGKIGGHCVTMSANLIPEKIRPPMIDIVAKYGK